MSRPTADKLQASWPWLVLALLAASILLGRLQLSFDLSAFFPSKTTLAHEVLLEQFRNGPGSRLLVIGISGDSGERLAEASDDLLQALKDDSTFLSVQNGEFPEDVDGLPEPVGSYFLLMRDVEYTQAVLQEAIQSRLKDLAFGGGASMLDLISQDPLLESLSVLEALTPVQMSGELWTAADGSAVIMAETRAASIDIAAQQEAIDLVLNEFSKIAAEQDLALEITGVGAFSVELQKTIRAEAQKRSILASIALILVIYAFYRRPLYVVLSALPLAMGFLVGLATVSLLYSNVHGITLAFGFTLMGVAIDYPLHLFSHARYSPPQVAIRKIWPTMRLGALSTAVAYIALIFAGSEGLAQLGVFTASGVLVSVLATRYWLPVLLDQRAVPEPNDGGPESTAALSYVPALAFLVLASGSLFVLGGQGVWDDRLATLSPVTEARLSIDRKLRLAAGTPDMRYQLVMHNTDLESLLRENEKVDQLLAQAKTRGLLLGFQSVTQVLPSEQAQERRKEKIPDAAALRESVDQLLVSTPFKSDAFEPFIQSAENVKTLPTLGPQQFSDTPLQSWLDARLLKIDENWVSLISIARPDIARLSNEVTRWQEQVTLVDVSESSIALMQNYRQGAVLAVAVAVWVIAFLIWYQRRQLAQLAWIAVTVAAAISITVVSIVQLHGLLTVIHFVALLLVMGLGLDYALFLSRTESTADRAASSQAVLACAVSTTLAFGILAASSIPVLKFLGLTVAVGSASSYLIAFAGSRLFSRKTSH